VTNECHSLIWEDTGGKMKDAIMGKSAERCPNCGSPVPATKTDSVPAMPDENYKGWPLNAVRYQRLHCPVCGYDGDRLVLVGKTRWNKSNAEGKA